MGMIEEMPTNYPLLERIKVFNLQILERFLKGEYYNNLWKLFQKAVC